MDFYEVLARAIEILQREGRTSYRALKRQFALDDDYLADLKVELIDVKQLAVDQDGTMLVWTGAAPPPPAAAPHPPPPESQLATQDASRTPADTLLTAPLAPDAERRQLTVLFCDLVDSTRLASQLDPEDLREVVRAYQATCAEVIQRFDGHIAQYLGDGLLVYFGYPQAHEDDAHRAVRTGLSMLEAMGHLNTQLEQAKDLRLAVRLGIHTGLVVVGEVGASGRQEQLALGETPNIAARLQGLATPDSVLISAATARLVEGYFTVQALGAQALKGVTQPVEVYRVLGASAVQSRLDAVAARGLTPLVGRELEVGLLRERWQQAKAGLGQVVVLRGEAGIGKSRLVEVLREWVGREGGAQITLRCSPYHTNSALYPVIEHLQRRLHWHRDETPAERLDKLEQTLSTYRLVLEDVVPLFATLLSVPLPARYPPLSLTPQQQRQQTQAALVAWLLEETQRQPVLMVCEDLHWVDPTTLEWLGLLLHQAPMARMLTLLTCRPEFQPPWTTRTQLTLDRLGRTQVTQMVAQLTGGKALPTEVVEQVLAKTDGVPLFVEELVKTMLESGLIREGEGRYVLTGPLPSLAIPTTLHDSLMARLDRLVTTRWLAQLGAVLGRDFSYEMIRAVTSLDEPTLQHGLAQLVEAELLYQRGLPPRAQYSFKHVLIQEAAYQSLLRSTRQQYHQQIAQVLAERFPDLAQTQPEFLAQHYTAAGLAAPAVDYWQRAGQRSLEHAAYVEAISHLSRGLEVLQTLAETPERARQELLIQTMLGPPLMNVKGMAAPEVQRAYARAHELCRQVGDTPQLSTALGGLSTFYRNHAALQTAQELEEQWLSLARGQGDAADLLRAHQSLGATLLWRGALTGAREHLERELTLYDPAQHRSLAFRHGFDPWRGGQSLAAHVLWLLGYPEQAMACMREALAPAQDLEPPWSLAFARAFAARLHQLRREGSLVQEQVESGVVLATKHELTPIVAMTTLLQGWALAMQGQGEAGLAQLRQGLVAWRALGAELYRPYWLALLAEVAGHIGQAGAGLDALAEALALADSTEERFYEAELHRLQGELLLVHAQDQPAAEDCFHQALAVARHQQAKALELRAATSLSRLWQRQGQRAEARELLAPIYGWFTEGFDTADLQEAQALLEELS